MKQPSISTTSFNMDNYEKWEAEGSEDTRQRANKTWKKLLAEYQAPPLDEAIRDELNAFVNHRRLEIQRGRPRTEWKG